MFAGAPLPITVVTSTAISVTTTQHAEGLVDLVVTNPDGRSVTLSGAYRFAIVLPLSITSVSPNVVSSAGALGVTIRGTGFLPGAVVTVDNETRKTAYGNTTTLYAAATNHAPAVVDVVVTNPDGQIVRLTGGLRYVPPATIPFSGTWTGEADDLRDDHRGVAMRFTIENNAVSSVTCGGATVDLSPAPAVRDGEFAFTGDNDMSVSGRILAPARACGTIRLPPCGPSWCAVQP